MSSVVGVKVIPLSVLHCASLLCTIFASLARANEHMVEGVHVHKLGTH